MSVEIAGDSSVSSSKYAVKARSGPEVDLETGNWWEIGKIIEEEKEEVIKYWSQNKDETGKRSYFNRYLKSYNIF